MSGDRARDEATISEALVAGLFGGLMPTSTVTDALAALARLSADRDTPHEPEQATSKDFGERSSGSTGLAARLREKADSMIYLPFVTDLLAEAADALAAAEAERDVLLRDDAAGRPFAELLREAADGLTARGDGPLADCLRLKSGDVAAAVSRPTCSPAPDHGGNQQKCPVCSGVGWYLDYSGGGSVEPLTLELLPCIHPECRASGRRVAHLSVNEAGFTRVVERGGHVLAVGRSTLAASSLQDPDDESDWIVRGALQDANKQLKRALDAEAVVGRLEEALRDLREFAPGHVRNGLWGQPMANKRWSELLAAADAALVGVEPRPSEADAGGAGGGVAKDSDLSGDSDDVWLCPDCYKAHGREEPCPV